jgi:methionyl aminopeptidase
VSAQVSPGITTKELDLIAREEIRKVEGVSVFYGYLGFPSHICLSVNDTVVHGFADERPLEEGDIVSLDFGIKYQGFIGDTARTICVGQPSKEIKMLVDVTRDSLKRGIAQAVEGNRVSDIGKAVENRVALSGFKVVRSFVGHGVGRKLHEPPQVYNYDPGPNVSDIILKAGMVLAIEPMVNIKSEKVKLVRDGWTAKTVDGLYSAHFEHTVLITNEEPEILTATEVFS